ncbi:MAG: hypothetical protein QME94_16825 [Anaerolineae bacterium]|nr:hypothetical protein [Anaerolineae bacterium]
MASRSKRSVCSCGWRQSVVALACLAFLAVACGRPPSPADVLRGLPPPAGWTLEEVRAFERHNLFDLVNGQAETYFAYGFQQVALAHYVGAEGATLDATIWQMATPADAYGLFTANRAGEQAPIGNDGDTDPGRRLAFWQGRCFVQVWARRELPQAELWALGKGIAEALPGGGERPALLSRLPSHLQKATRVIYFHEEISIESELWLGGENILGLSPKTEGFLVLLPLDGARAYLLLVQYPDGEAATAAQGRLQSDALERPVAARAVGRLLAAVFGEVDATAAGQVLAEVLGSQ